MRYDACTTSSASFTSLASNRVNTVLEIIYRKVKHLGPYLRFHCISMYPYHTVDTCKECGHVVASHTYTFCVDEDFQVRVQYSTV